MTTKYNVVGVCSGNIQRSPTFEAVMNHELNRDYPDLVERVRITSAGTNALQYLTNTESPERIIKILKGALKYGVVPALALDEVKKYVAIEGNAKALHNLQDADREKLRLLHRIVRPELSRMNIKYRDQAFQQRGINLSTLVSAKPFRPEAGYDLVIGMEDETTRKVIERYGGRTLRTETSVDVLEADIPGQRIVNKGKVLVKVPQITSYAFFIDGSPVAEDIAGGLESALAHVDYFLDTRQIFFRELGRLVPHRALE